MRKSLVYAGSALTLSITLAACSNDPTRRGTDPGGAEGGSTSTLSATITAQLFYREKIALPPDAVAFAELKTASSGTVVAGTRVELNDQSIPVPVTLSVDQVQLPPDPGLVFGSRIEVDGVAEWQSEPRPLELTSGRIDLGSVMLIRIARSDRLAADTPTTDFLAGIWVVEDIRGKGIIDNSRVTLDFNEQRLSGRASCNFYQGTWSLEDRRISVSDLAVTMMSCPEALMNQERHFLDALAAADGIRYDDTGALFLVSGGEDLLRARREH